MRNKIKQIDNEVWAWHGTGRYQYDNNGEIIDILKSILDGGGLRMIKKDPWLKIEGKLRESISLARIRVYARIYADAMQENPDKHQFRYYSSKFWFLVIGVIHILRSPLGIITHLIKLQFNKDSSKLLNSHITRFRKTTNILKQPFMFKLFNMPSTDIKDNYGIIIGIKSNPELCLKMDVKYSLYEYRTKRDIPLSKFSYIEVPKDKVEEVKKLLNQYKLDIDVYTIGMMERYYKSKGLFFTLKPRNFYE